MARNHGPSRRVDGEKARHDQRHNGGNAACPQQGAEQRTGGRHDGRRRGGNGKASRSEEQPPNDEEQGQHGTAMKKGAEAP